MTLPAYAPPPMAPVPVVHADRHIVIADKPAGLLSVPGRGPDKADCLVARLQEQFPDVLSVHRLDMETSGLMVLARDAATHAALSRQFERRTVGKTYEAVVSGIPEDEAGVIALPIGADWPNRPRQRIDASNGKASRTVWQVIGQEGDDARLKLVPETGRTHQLRLHLDAIGHPILGDQLYGPPDAREAAVRLLLHATGLAFIHPATGEDVRLTSPCPF